MTKSIVTLVSIFLMVEYLIQENINNSLMAMLARALKAWWEINS